jgi:hypothetical protein
MNDLTKYILFVFAKNDNPKEFTEQIAEELCVISDTPNLNFYFGPESSVFTISTLDSHQDVKDYVDMILGVGDIMYVLLPYTSDNLSYGLPEKISKHLFNDGISDFMSEKPNNSYTEEFEVRKMIQDKIRDTFDLNIENFDFEYDEDEDDEWTDIDEIKNKQRAPSLDELLDKIKEEGLNSLTEKELLQLNKYSN